MAEPNLRITLSFRAEGGPLEREALTAFLRAMVEHQDYGTRIGIQDLVALGFAGVEMVGAACDPGLGEEAK
jgi:hypothetical protein